MNSITDIDFYDPQFTDVPGDFSTDEDYTDLSISWTVIGLHPATYSIELDGTEVVSATAWSNGIAISYDIPDGLLEGNYNITIIIIMDDNGNIAQNAVIFTINCVDTTEDPIDNPPDEEKPKIPGFPLV